MVVLGGAALWVAMRLDSDFAAKVEAWAAGAREWLESLDGSTTEGMV